MPSADPVLAGFHPDPSVCRVGEDYFLATSSFAYHPGIPIHRSSDLQTWELIGHALVGESWLPVEAFDVSDGIWAPTIRHHAGTFYIVFPLARDRHGIGLYVTTATDARGPWSRPRRLAGEGIDPSLFFDDDGRCWFTAARNSETVGAHGPGEIWLREFNPGTLTLVGPTSVLWHGAVAGAWVEAPHLYRRGDVYFLICAEGGTERNHAVTAAVSTSVRGPYHTDPRSPLLTHRHLDGSTPIQNVGHADLVDGADGECWAFLLGVRPIDGHHTLGRETFAVPVFWDTHGPVFDDVLSTRTAVPYPAEPARPREWISLRGPVSSIETPQGIVLWPRPASLADEAPAYLALRQDAHTCHFEVTIDTSLLADQSAGIAAFQNGAHFVTLALESDSTGVCARVRAESGGSTRILAEVPVRARTRLSIRATPRSYEFGIANDGAFQMIARVPHTALSTETAGGFVGVTLGVFNNGGVAAPPVAFEDVAYVTMGDDTPDGTSGAPVPPLSLSTGPVL